MPDSEAGIAYRVSQLEQGMRDLARDFRQAQPEVIAERVERLIRDLADLRRHVDAQHVDLRQQVDAQHQEVRDEQDAQRKILIGTWVSLATGLIIAYVLGGNKGTSVAQNAVTNVLLQLVGAG